MHAYDLAVLGFCDHLYKSSFLSCYLGFAVCHERELADFDLAIFLCSLLFCKSYACDLRLDVNSARDLAVIHYCLFTADIFYCYDTFHRSCMREHRLAVHIAYRIYTVNRGLEHLVCNDSASFSLDAESFSIYACKARSSADCHQHLLCRELLYFAVLLEPDAVCSDLSNLCTGVNIDAELFQVTCHLSSDLFVHHRKYAVEEFDYAHLYAYSSEEVCEFYTDDSAADDYHRFRCFVYVEHLRACQHCSFR